MKKYTAKEVNLFGSIVVFRIIIFNILNQKFV